MLSSPHAPTVPQPSALPPLLSLESPDPTAHLPTDKQSIQLAIDRMKQFIAENQVSPASSTHSSPVKQEQPASTSFGSPPRASASAMQFAPPRLGETPLEPLPSTSSVAQPSSARRSSGNTSVPTTTARTLSPPKTVRSRPSLEEVLESRPPTSKRRPSVESALSDEVPLGVRIVQGGERTMEWDHGDEEESIERTPSPYLGDDHHHQRSMSALADAAFAAPEAPRSDEHRMDGVVEGERKTGGLLDHLLNKDSHAAKPTIQRRRSQRMEDKTPPIGVGPFSGKELPAAPKTGPVSAVEQQTYGPGLPSDAAYYQPSHERTSSGFLRSASFNEPASHASTSYLQATASLPIASHRMLSDPFIGSLPRMNATGSIHSSPSRSIASPYHAPPGLIKAGSSFAAQVHQSPRQDKDCFWSSSPSRVGAASDRSSSASVASREGLSRPTSRSSEGSDDEYATPGPQPQDLPFVSDEASSNSSHHTGSVFDSGGRSSGAHLYAPHSAVAGGSRLGSLLQAGQMASEHAGFSSPLKTESAVGSDKEAFGKRRGRLGQSDAGDSESELEAEDDEEDERVRLQEQKAAASASRKGKGREKEEPASDSSATKKKGGKVTKPPLKGLKLGRLVQLAAVEPVDTSEGGSPSPGGAPREADLAPVGLPPGPTSTAKPAYSYAGLIGQAILAHPQKRLSLAGIYDWITAAYPFYVKGESGWMNSIRHNLSLNQCFIKKERDPNGPVGKGMLWTIEEGTEGQFANGGYKKNRPGVNGGGKGKKGAAAAVVPSGSTSDSSVVRAPGSAKRGRPLKKVDPAFDSDDEEVARLNQNGNPGGPLFVYNALPDSPAFSSPVFGEKVAPLAPPPPKKQKKSKAKKSDGPAFTTAWTAPSAPAASDAFGSASASAVKATLSYNAPRHPMYQQQANGRDSGYYVGEGGLVNLEDDDFATPQRPRSRGPPTAEPTSSSGGMMVPPLATRGLPHLTPSVSSPVSSPGPQTMPRPNSRAHEAYQKSSLHEPEGVKIREEEEPEEEDFAADMETASEMLEKDVVASGSLQPAFSMQPMSARPAAPAVAPGSPSPLFAAGLSAGISLSPMSSMRGTGPEGDDDANDPYQQTFGYPPFNSHGSPLQTRTRERSGHRRILSHTGSLMAHALKTPAMQPISSSPGNNARQHHHNFDGIPHSPLSSSTRRHLAYGASNGTPKGYNYPPSFSGTPARTPFHPSMNQSPAGAAALQFHAEMGGSAMNGDYTADPYSARHHIHDALGQFDGAGMDSPASQWGGGGGSEDGGYRGQETQTRARRVRRGG